MLAPLAVDGLQQNLLFDRAHGVGPNCLGLGGHHLVGGLAETLADHVVVDAFLVGPFGDGRVDVEPVFTAA
jgi:hypothetical protein